MITRRIAVPAVVLFVLSPLSQADAKTFRCAGGDVNCLISAIEAANVSGKANTILLAAGVYTVPARPVPGGFAGLPLIAGGPLTIAGEGADTTIIERPTFAENYTLMTIAGEVSLSGLTFRNGGGEFSHPGPGAISSSGRLTISKSVFSGNKGREGGALGLGGPTTIINTTFSGNQGVEGGAIYVIGAAVVDLASSTFVGNTAFFGGALDVQRGGTTTVTNSTFASNQSAFTGGVVQEGIAPDAAVPPGQFRPGTITITNSTIAGNSVTVQSISSSMIDHRLGTIHLKDTILADNSAVPGDCPQGATSLGLNLLRDATACASFLTATDLTGDAALGAYTDDGAPGHGYFPLTAQSLAIDHGGAAPQNRRSTGADCSFTDQIGQRRSGSCDIGAIEFVIDRVTIRQTRFDDQTGALFVSAGSSAERDDVSLTVSVANCFSDLPMLKLNRSYLLLTTTNCGDIGDALVTVNSSGGGSAEVRIR